MKSSLLTAVSLVFAVTGACAQAVEFDLVSGNLIIPMVRAGETSLYNVVLQLGADGRFTPTAYSTTPSAIVGSWTAGTATISFYADGTWTHSQSTFSGTEAEQIRSQVWAGTESGGTYTWNQTTGDLKITCPTVDTNGSAGFSNGYSGGFTGYKGTPIGTCRGASEPRKIVAQENSITFTTVDGSFTLPRVQSPK